MSTTLHVAMTALASALGVVVGGTYCWQAATQPGKAPHVVKWALLTVFAVVICAAQVSAGAGAGALVLAIAAVTNGINTVTGLVKRGTTDITTSAKWCALAGLVAIILWWGTGDPATAAVILSVASAVAFTPTWVRTWNEPETEVQRTYWWNTIRYACATLAVAHFSVATALYPATWVLLNASFSVYHAYCLRRAHPALVRLA